MDNEQLKSLSDDQLFKELLKVESAVEDFAQDVKQKQAAYKKRLQEIRSEMERRTIQKEG